MRKILSLALILSLLLSCGVFASPDAVVPESADEALEEVSEIEENAELSVEEIEINYDFSKITTVPSGITIPATWKPTITNGALQITIPGSAQWQYGAVVSFALEEGATYKISAKIKSSAATSYFLVGAGTKQDTKNQLIAWSKAQTTTITNKTYTVDSNNFAGMSLDNGGLYLGGKSSGTTFDIYSLKVVKIRPAADVPYSLADDSNINISKLPENFCNFNSIKYTSAEVVDNKQINVTLSGWACAGFALNLEDGETYNVHISGEASNTSDAYFVGFAGGIQTKNPLLTINNKNFTYDGTFTVTADNFKNAYDVSKLSSDSGFALTAKTATDFVIKEFTVTKVTNTKKTFTADNENIFTNGDFENGDPEIYPVVSTTAEYALVSGADNVKDGNYALKVTPGASNAWVNMGTEIEWQIDRKYELSFDIKVLEFANNAAVTSGTATLNSLVYFYDKNANKGAQHTEVLNKELLVGSWQHIEGTIDLSALECNNGKGIASDADLKHGADFKNNVASLNVNLNAAFAIWFAPENNQNYNYIIDNISLVRLPYETDIDVSYDFDKTTRIFGAQWVHHNVAKRFGVGINDIKSEIAADPINETNKVLKVTQNVSYGALAFHMPLAENYTYTYSYDIYIADNTKNVATNFVFNDDLASGENQKTISHPQIVKGTVPANTWTHVEGSFTPVKTTAQSGQTRVADNVNLGENYFSIYAYDKNTFYIDNLVIKSYEPWNDEIAAQYAPTADTENFSVRADENSGIRTLASVTSEQRTACTEYGFIVALTSTLEKNNEELTFDATSKHISGVSYGTVEGKDIDKNYGFKNDSIVFAAVFTGITAANYDKALTFRPYLKLTYPNGGEKVVYGEAITKSVVDVVTSLNNAESIKGMTEAQIEFCKGVVPNFGA